jgi:Peptide methionine sulfoxide reductase
MVKSNSLFYKREIFYTISWYIFYLVFGLPVSNAQVFYYPKNNPVELGKVEWLRNYDDAVIASTGKNLPILILFQEVPGCSNCTTFGNDILSHPLVVEAIETCFVPLCIYNNHAGDDKIILDKFGEPSWNNPVIQVIGRDGTDIVPRQADFRSMTKTIGTLIEAIKISDSQPPEYLKILLEETEARQRLLREEAYFSMYCFWSGEKEIAGLSGVIATEAGYMDGKEVVKVSYRSDKTSLADLYMKAKKVGCGDNVYASLTKKNGLTVMPVSTYKKDNEDKYYLSKSPYKVIPMTELQKTKVNRAIGMGQDPAIFLSPRQIAMIKNKKITKSQVSASIEKVWWKL